MGKSAGRCGFSTSLGTIVSGLVLFFLTTSAFAQPSWQQRQKVISPTPEVEGSFSGNTGFDGVDMSADGNVLAVGALAENAGGLDRGAVHVFRRTGTQPFTLETTILRTPPANGVYFGSLVRISGDGNTIVVRDQTSTTLFVYRLIAGVWTSVGAVTTDEAGWRGYGFELDFNGMTLVVARSGFIDIWRAASPLDNFSLARSVDLGPTGSLAGGVALSSDGTLAAVGYPSDDSDVWGPTSNPGAVWVVQRGATWSDPPQVSKLTPADHAPTDQFGAGVAMTANGGTIYASSVAKTVGTDKHGVIYEFQRGAGWTTRTAHDAALPALPINAFGDFGSRMFSDAAGRFLTATSSTSNGGLWLFDHQLMVWREVTPTDRCQSEWWFGYQGGHLSADGKVLAAGSGNHCYNSGYALPGGAVWLFDYQPAPDDTDEDGLPDAWEQRFGLTGPDGAPNADPDHDSVSNMAELAAGTHPRSFVTRYLAEGATGTFFDTTIALLNPTAVESKVQFRFLTTDLTTVTHFLVVPPFTRRTVLPKTLTGLASASFSTIIEADETVVVDRTMTWDQTSYGSHSDTAIVSPATTWYLAEGSTSAEFRLFYLLQNPQSTEVIATVRYLSAVGGPPIEKTYRLPPASRTTIEVDEEGPELASTDLGAVVTAPLPIIVERAMYLTRQGQAFAAGHESAGVTAPALEWFLAEGATGPFFDLFILLANPNATAANITVDYLLLGGGTLAKSYVVPANGRHTIFVDDEELPAGSGNKPLVNVAVSTVVRATNNVPIIVERTMWWPSPETTANYWYESHNSPGSTVSASRWAIADGEVGGSRELETYILIANTSTVSGSVKVTCYFEDGSTRNHVLTVPFRSRSNMSVSDIFPGVSGRFGAVIESTGDPLALVVERATYASAPGMPWTAGANALGTPLP
jgi:hypothetical protein